MMGAWGIWGFSRAGGAGTRQKDGEASAPDLGEGTLSHTSGGQAPLSAYFLLATLLLADFTPRFFQGDSFSYLLTDADGWIPPDRSWLFGFIVSFVVRHAHAYGALMLLQVCVLGGMIAMLRPFFRGHRRIFAAAALCLALDPLLELYARFVMSDLLAAAMFIAALCGLLAIADRKAQPAASARGACILVAATIAAVFLRVAYAPIIEAAILIAGAILFRRLSSQGRALLAAAAAAPVLAVLLLVGANSVIFRNRFPHELFVTKLSGVYLASVFAPALDPADFAQAGIPVSPAEFAALDLGSYNKRLYQVWGGPPYTLHLFIGAKLGIQQEYTQAVDAASLRLVRSAFLRNPLAFVRVYAEGLREYLTPGAWRAHAEQELGLNLRLPQKFVEVSAKNFGAKLDAGVSEKRSLLIRAYLAIEFLYPFQLEAGVLAAFVLLARAPRHSGAIVLAAGLIADLAAAPLYSNFVIPRYVLGAVFLSTALIILALQRLFQISSPALAGEEGARLRAQAGR